MPPDDLMVFVHIPKCAGTALNTWFASSHHYGNLYVKASNLPVTALRWDDVNPVDLADRNLRSVASHHLRTFPKTAGGRNLRYITVLREPILRWISHVRFYHLLRPDGGMPERTLREYAEWMLEQPEWTVRDQINAQTNFLAEHEWYRMNRGDVALIDWAADPSLFDRYRSRRLSLAEDKLMHFDLVGTVERIDEFIRVLQVRAAEWSVPLTPLERLPLTHQTEAPLVDATWIMPGDTVGRRLLDAFAEDIELFRLADELLTREIR